MKNWANNSLKPSLVSINTKIASLVVFVSMIFSNFTDTYAQYSSKYYASEDERKAVLFNIFESNIEYVKYNVYQNKVVALIREDYFASIKSLQLATLQIASIRTDIVAEYDILLNAYRKELVQKNDHKYIKNTFIDKIHELETRKEKIDSILTEIAMVFPYHVVLSIKQDLDSMIVTNEAQIKNAMNYTDVTYYYTNEVKNDYIDAEISDEKKIKELSAHVSLLISKISEFVQALQKV